MFGWKDGHGPVQLTRCAKERRPLPGADTDAAIGLNDPEPAR
jgi:hypothetical protein